MYIYIFIHTPIYLSPTVHPYIYIYKDPNPPQHPPFSSPDNSHSSLHPPTKPSNLHTLSLLKFLASTLTNSCDRLEGGDIYFSYKGENQTVLSDVKQVNAYYTFKGEESWQPLTEFTGVKCKRCGFYERDNFKSDDVFDE